MPEIVTTDNKSVESLHAEMVALVKEGQTKVDAQLRQIEERGKASEALGGEISKINEQVANLKEQLVQVRADVNRPAYLGGEEGEEQGVFDRMLKDQDLKKFLERGYHKGSISVNVGSLHPEPKATTITSTTVGSSTSGILVPARVRDYIAKPERRLTIRDILPSSPVQNNAVEYPQESAFTNAASPQSAEGAAKSEAALTFTIATANVRTIAHWIPASKQVLDDWAQLRRIIENKMLYGLAYREEAEILSGSGTGVHLSGLTTQATAYADTYNDTGDTRIDTLANAICEIEDGDEMSPDFMVVHPADWLRVLKVKDQASGVGNYVVGVPSAPMQITTLWGKKVVVTNSMTSGYFLTGNSQMAEVFERQNATVGISTEHSDYWTKNLVALLVESRIALAVYRTTAFMYGAF